MGSHMMDMAYWALDLELPTTCEAQGTPISTDTCPQWLTATWDHPANDWRPAVKVYWYDGGKKPGMPSEIFDREKLFKGVLFSGDKGFLMCDYEWRILMPTKGDMTQYTLAQERGPDPAVAGPSPGVDHRLQDGQAHAVQLRLRRRDDREQPAGPGRLPGRQEARMGRQEPQGDQLSRGGPVHPKKYRQGWVLNG